ncbi:MAG: hypothetical protein Q9176_005132 [Flavoplaca citrina]
MDIRHTFSNEYPQDQHRRRSRKNHPRPPKDPLHSIPAEPPDDGQVDRLLSRMLELPQELVDLIKEQLLELFFCPGYYLPQILNQDYHKWNKKTHRIARPEMLLLNRSIYHRYAQRMWSENTCAVKTKAGPYAELIPSHGPLDHYNDRFAYIVEQKKEESLWLHNRAHLAYGPRPLHITALHGNPAFPNRAREHWSAIYVQWMIGQLSTFHRTKTFAISALKFIETYDSISAWTSIDLPQKYEEAQDALTSLVEPLDAPWQKMLWKAFMAMVKRKKKYHTEPVPAMANRYREVEAYMYLISLVNHVLLPTPAPSIKSSRAHHGHQINIHLITSTRRSQHSNLIRLLRTKLPQELFDQIESTVYEMVFCPGHLYFDVSGTDSEAIEENFLIFQRPLEVARPEMLCLSKDIYQKYAVRMWQENICIVKTESGKVRQMELVRGHLEDSLGYLESIGEDPIAIQDLRTRQTARAEDYQVLNAVRVASQTPVEGLPNCVLSFAITLQDFKKQPFFNEIYSKVPLVHRYGPSGEWLGLDLRQPSRDDLWDRGGATGSVVLGSCGKLWL